VKTFCFLQSSILMRIFIDDYAASRTAMRSFAKSAELRRLGGPGNRGEGLNRVAPADGGLS
jgi:hypothetical protein